MANETVIGRVDGNEIIFVQGECEYIGCFNSEGPSIDFTIDNANCDDTYNACWNNAEKRYEASIPDDCCNIEECTNCPSFTTPEQVGLVLTGFTAACFNFDFGSYSSYPEQAAVDELNGVHNLYQTDPEQPCRWLRHIDFDPYYTYTKYADLDCAGAQTYLDIEYAIIDVWRLPDDEVLISASLLGDDIFTCTASVKFDMTGVTGTCITGGSGPTPEGSLNINFGTIVSLSES